MASVSSDVLWEVLRHSNSYTIRRDNRDFSSDPFSLNNTQRRKFFGAASSSAVGVSTRTKGDPVVLRLKKLRKNQPKKNHFEDRVSIKRGGFAGNAKNALKHLLEARNPTLVQTGLQRMDRLHKSEVAHKPISKKN
jgi:hypothetical protein